METETPFKVNDSTGVYTSWRPVSADEIIQQAKVILEERFKPSISFKAPGDASEFLIAKLAELASEVFCILFLDNRHQLIKFEEMFFETINGTSVYPREVVKRALGYNASALILAHNRCFNQNLLFLMVVS